MESVTEDVLEVVARGIYLAFARPLEGAPWYDALPVDARDFLRLQARAGLERLRQNVTPGMIEAGSGLDDPESVFVAMLDHVLREKVQ